MIIEKKFFSIFCLEQFVEKCFGEISHRSRDFFEEQILQVCKQYNIETNTNKELKRLINELAIKMKSNGDCWDWFRIVYETLQLDDAKWTILTVCCPGEIYEDYYLLKFDCTT